MRGKFFIFPTAQCSLTSVNGSGVSSMLRESAKGHEPDGTTLKPTVAVVDPNPAVADVVKRLSDGRGIDVPHFDSAEDFLNRARLDEPGCVVAAAELPGIG